MGILDHPYSAANMFKSYGIDYAELIDKTPWLDETSKKEKVISYINYLLTGARIACMNEFPDKPCSISEKYITLTNEKLRRQDTVKDMIECFKASIEAARKQDERNKKGN